MNKYAFLVNVPNLSSENYSESFDDGEWLSLVAGLNGVDKVLDYAKGLIADGYSLINLCGDFGEEHVAELMKDAPEGTEIHYAAYSPEETAKLEALDQYKEYAQIIFGGVDEPLHFEMTSPDLNTHTVFIKDLEQAIQEAQHFAKAGVDGIELCSSFDPDMTKTIIAEVEAINPKIPVGSNGISL